MSITRLFNAIFSLEARAFVNWEGKIQKGKPEKYGLQGQLITKALLDNRIFVLVFSCTIWLFRGNQTSHDLY